MRVRTLILYEEELGFRLNSCLTRAKANEHFKAVIASNRPNILGRPITMYIEAKDWEEAVAVLTNRLWIVRAIIRVEMGYKADLPVYLTNFETEIPYFIDLLRKHDFNRETMTGWRWDRETGDTHRDTHHAPKGACVPSV